MHYFIVFSVLFRQITGGQFISYFLLAFRACDVSSIDNEYLTVDDLLKAAQRQSDGKSTRDVSSEIDETLAKIKQQAIQTRCK